MNNRITKRKYILRRKTNDSENDKYSYYKSCSDGVEMTTPFLQNATIFQEGDEVFTVSNDWKLVVIKPKLYKTNI